MKLMMVANEIYKRRSAISESIKSDARYSLRSTMSSSQIYSILKKAGIYIELPVLKSLLREFGFNWNGPSCSLYEVFVSSKEFTYGQTEEEYHTGKVFQQSSEPLLMPEDQRV